MPIYNNTNSNALLNLINLEYEYNPLDIYQILLARLDRLKDAGLLSNQEIIVKKPLINISPDNIVSVLENKKTNARIELLTIRLSENRWVGILLKYKKADLETVIYVDAINSNNIEIHPLIVEAFRTINYTGSIKLKKYLSDSQIGTDTTHFNNAIYVVENLLFALEDKNLISLPNAVTIRVTQLADLNRYNSNYSHGFKFRQQKNITYQDDQILTMSKINLLLEGLLDKKDSALKSAADCDLLHEIYRTKKVNGSLVLELKSEYSTMDGFVNHNIQLIAAIRRISWNKKAVERPTFSNPEAAAGFSLAGIFSIRFLTRLIPALENAAASGVAADALAAGGGAIIARTPVIVTVARVALSTLLSPVFGFRRSFMQQLE